jgi:glioma pathogenesis-related protein 2
MSLEKFQEEFINEALEAHNEYRQMHGTPELEHNKELSKLAFEWAKKIAKKNKLEHSGIKYKNDNLGENLALWFKQGAKKFNGNEASKQWYEEIEHYDYNKPEFNVKSGNFTQLIWKNTKEVGFGVAVASNGHFYAVAYYYPPGNVLTEFRNNVLPFMPKKIQNNKFINKNTSNYKRVEVEKQKNAHSETVVTKQPKETKVKEVQEDIQVKESKKSNKKSSSGCC